MSFSDIVGEKLVKADDIDIERFNAELTNIAEKAVEGDTDSQEVLSIIFDEPWESIEHNLNQPFSEMQDWWIDGVHAYAEWKGTHASRSAAAAEDLKLQEIEKQILQFCTKPRTSSFIIELFPARPYNILGIVENLKRRGLIALASNHYVTNVSHREFMPAMTMVASRKTATDKYKKIASKWDSFSAEKKAEILTDTHLQPEYIEDLDGCSWHDLLPWVQANIEYTLELPEEHIEIIALQDVDSGVILSSDEQIIEGLSSGLEYYTAYATEGKKANKEEWHWGILSELVGETVKVGNNIYKVTENGHELIEAEKKTSEEIGIVKYIEDEDTGEKVFVPRKIVEALESNLEYWVYFGNKEPELLTDLIDKAIVIGNRIYKVTEEGLESVHTSVEKEAKEWVVNLDVKDLWEEAKELDEGDEEGFILVRDKIVQKLRSYAGKIGKRIGQEQEEELQGILDNLQETPDIEEFDFVWNDLYDWADINSVWVGAL